MEFEVAPRSVVATLILGALFLAGCGSGTGALQRTETNLAAAEGLIDAFYSFDPAKLKGALSSAEESVPKIVYYQGWAEGGNYQIVERAPCREESPEEVACSITVKDDLIGALGLPLHVTDTFHVTFSNGRIVRVRTSSNDPELFNEALEWVQRERTSLVEEPCRGFFDGGPTPQECVRAVVQGFGEFAAGRH